MESNQNVEIVVPAKQSFATEWASDQKAFKGVPWGKAMMWIFLVSDTFIFSIFLISYMTVRFSTKAEWPNPSEGFGLTVFSIGGWILSTYYLHKKFDVV